MYGVEGVCAVEGVCVNESTVCLLEFSLSQEDSITTLELQFLVMSSAVVVHQRLMPFW